MGGRRHGQEACSSGWSGGQRGGGPAGRDAQGRLHLEGERRRRTWRLRGRSSSATSSTTWCSIRATGARCSLAARRPATSARPCSARPTSAGPGRRPRAPGVPEGARGREGPRRRSHVLAHAGPRQRAGRLVRRHLAAGAVPLRGRRRSPGSRCPGSTTIRSTAPGWAARRTARRTGRSCTRSSSIRAIPRTSTSPCRAAACTSRVDGGGRWAPLIEGLEVVEGFDPANVTFHDPHCVRLCPTQPGPALPAEPLRHLPARPPVEPVGAHRQDHAEAGRRHRLPDGGASARRRDRLGVPDGRQRASGRAPARTASRPSTSRATAARPGSGSTPACPRSQAWWTVKRQAMTADAHDPVGLYFGTTSGELWTSRDERRALDAASRATCRRSTPWRPPTRCDAR